MENADVDRALSEMPDLEPLRSVLIEWYAYRRDCKWKKWRYPTLLRNLKKARSVGLDCYAEAVTRSMDNQWQGIFPKENKNGYRPKPGEQPERLSLRTLHLRSS